MTNYRYWLQITSSSWSFVSAILGISLMELSASAIVAFCISRAAATLDQGEDVELFKAMEIDQGACKILRIVWFLSWRPSASIIEDWVSDSEDESEAVLTRSRLVPLNAARPVTNVVPQTHVKHQRPAKHVVNKPHSLIRRPINHRPTPKISNFHQKVTTVKTKKVNVVKGTKGNWGNPQHALKDKGVIDSGCSRHMTGNISYLSDFKEINRGYVAFGGNPKGGKITGKGKIRTGKIDFDDVYFVKELKFNLFSVLQMCDKKNNVLFTDTECVVLSSNFKLPDKNHAALDESNRWHRRLGHINFKTMNKLVKGNLVRGLPSKFCGIKWIKREFSVARTPQQNGVAKRKNRTLIEASRTMLVDSLFPIPFWAKMVNTRTDADLSTAVQNALQTLLPQIREEIHEEFRTGSGSSNAGGNPPPVTIHTWLERFNKQKPHSFEKATTHVDAENWISHMEMIFDRFLRLAGFLRAAAGTEEEQAKNF
nr:hypothetical protein [Tanacetum cinerariifolium]